MASKFSITKSVKWCTELPTMDCSRESPVFTVKGNVCLCRFVLVQMETFPFEYYKLYLELKSQHTELKPCSGHLEVNFRKKMILNVGAYEFRMSKSGSQVIWSISKNNFDLNLPLYYTSRKWITFLLSFDYAPEGFSNITEAIETKPEAVTGHHATQKRRKLSDSGMNIHLKALSRDFSKLLEESSNCDVRISCEGKIFNAHRNILGIRSAVFSAMLESDMVEGKTGLIKVEDFSASIFQSFLVYLYSGTVPNLNMETAKQFYEIADKYAVMELKTACSEFLSMNLSENNACEILVLVDRHGDKEFRKNVITYIINKKIPQNDSEWPSFCENYCKLAIEVQNLYIQKYCPK